MQASGPELRVRGRRGGGLTHARWCSPRRLPTEHAGAARGGSPVPGDNKTRARS